MSAKKIILIVGGIFVVLGLIVVLFVGAIAFFTFHTISNSEAAETARGYLRNNEILKQDIGEVKDFGSLITGSINVSNGDGEATIYIKAIGEKRNANVRVDLAYRSNRSWRVIGASYDRDGQTIDLMRAYEPASSASP